MARIPDVFNNTLDQIDYLVDEKFGRPSFAPCPSLHGRPNDERPLDSKAVSDRSAAIDAYRSELLNYGAEEIRRLAREAIKLSTERHEKAAAEEELSRSWNQPNAKADFKFWSASSYWTIEEGVALLLEKDPRRVTWDDLRPYSKISALASRFEEIQQLAQRAATVKIIGPVNIPSVFLRWAERSDLTVPSELRTQVNARGIVIADWRDAFEKAQAKIQERDNLISQSAAVNDKLNTELQELRAKLAERPSGTWPWGEHQTELLKHLAAAAEKFWKLYDPQDQGTAPTSPKVKDWLCARGVAVRVSEVMAQILRADNLKPGRRT